MVIIGGWVFFMSEVTLYSSVQRHGREWTLWAVSHMLRSTLAGFCDLGSGVWGLGFGV